MPLEGTWEFLYHTIMAKYLEGKGPITVNFLTTFEGNLRITFYHIYAGKVLRKGFRTNKFEQKLALV